MSNTDLSLSNVQLNNSSSKMKYSFPKSSRFDYNRYKYYSPYYLVLPLLPNSMTFLISKSKEEQASDTETKWN